MPSTTTDRLYGLTTSVAVKSSCRAATTVAIAARGEQTIDGVAVATGDRVLRKNETDAVLNGIWVVQTGDWTRAPDFNGSLDVVTGTLVFIPYGAANGVSIWRCTSSGVIIIGTDEITWEELPLFPGTNALLIPLVYVGTPGDGEWMGGYIFKDAATIAADFGGGAGLDAAGSVKTNPAAPYVIVVTKNGSTIGTITIATNGAFTFATSGGTSVSFVEDDQLDFYGPGSAGTAANFTVMLVASLVN